MNELLTINEVAKLLRIHRNTVVRWLNQGVFPNAIDFQDTKRIPMADIEALKRPKKEAM